MKKGRLVLKALFSIVFIVVFIVVIAGVTSAMFGGFTTPEQRGLIALNTLHKQITRVELGGNDLDFKTIEIKLPDKYFIKEIKEDDNNLITLGLYTEDIEGNEKLVESRVLENVDGKIKLAVIVPFETLSGTVNSYESRTFEIRGSRFAMTNKYCVLVDERGNKRDVYALKDKCYRDMGCLKELSENDGRSACRPAEEMLPS